MPKVLFERYDSKTDSWEPLTHFAYSRERSNMEIAGYAVCHGCILISTCNFRFEFMVFHIDSNTWHQVDISRKEAYYSAFRGRAVVVGNSIYALSIQWGKVIALSLKIKIGNDGRITYSLEEPFFLPGLESRVENITESGLISRPTEYLVHLGKLEFCLLQTISTDLEESQEMFITTFEIVCDDETMHIKTLDSSVCDFHIGHSGTLRICFGFMPKCEDFEPEEEESFRVAHKKGTAKKNNALDGFISMIKSSKRVKWPPKYVLRRLAAAFHPLPLSNYSSFEGVLCCKPHFDQLFEMTGSFDKSFEGIPKTVRERSDQVAVDGTSYHKPCFRCTHGGCVISPSNYVAHEHCLYCRHHHSQLFKEKGNFSQLSKHDEVKEVTENTDAEA